MIELHGTGVSSGIAIGQMVAFSEGKETVSRNIGTPEQEWNDFLSAQEITCAELSHLAEKARKDAGDEAALLFETHCEMAQDPDFCDCIKELTDSGKDAVSAVMEAGEQFAAMFESMDDAYTKERAADIRDVASRICRILRGESEDFALSAPSVVIAEDLSPSQTMQLDKSLLLGFATRKGSPVSHTAILSRILGIPAIVGLGDKLLSDFAGKCGILDGIEGKLIIEPDTETLTYYNETKAAFDAEKAGLSALIGKETVTKSGKRTKLYCNIGSPSDVDKVLSNDGEGIGLFRSEFLFLGRDSAPTEDEQFEAYKSVLEKMDGKPVIVRTMDIGADKKADYLGLSDEENPALGLRGLRLSLEHPDWFKRQLRALYRASVYGNLSVMFPMVANVWEVEKAKDLCREVQIELKMSGIPYCNTVKLGIMIETPAAALISGELAKIVDFFSVGTNDLTQYTLACDRQNGSIAPHLDPHHPAILSQLKMIAENAHQAGIPVGICGELGADESLTEFFLAIGIDELSVSPSCVLPLRKNIRNQA